MFFTTVKKIGANPRFGLSKKEYKQELFNCFLRKFGRDLEQNHDKIFIIDGDRFHLIKNDYGSEVAFTSLKKIDDFV